MKYQLEGTMHNNYLSDQHIKYQLEGTMYNNHLCFTLLPLIGISWADYSNGYCTMLPLIGISCTDHINGYWNNVQQSFVWSVHEIPIRGNNVQ
jgi:hypothetical protein